MAVVAAVLVGAGLSLTQFWRVAQRQGRLEAGLKRGFLRHSLGQLKLLWWGLAGLVRRQSPWTTQTARQAPLEPHQPFHFFEQGQQQTAAVAGQLLERVPEVHLAEQTQQRPNLLPLFTREAAARVQAAPWSLRLEVLAGFKAAAVAAAEA